MLVDLAAGIDRAGVGRHARVHAGPVTADLRGRAVVV